MAEPRSLQLFKKMLFGQNAIIFGLSGGVTQVERFCHVIKDLVNFRGNY